MENPEHLLLHRISKIPIEVMSDYANGEGEDDAYRYLGLQTKYPWGALVRHVHTCSSVNPNVYTTTALRGSSFHFIVDGALCLKNFANVKRWTLKIGGRIIQNVDSWFASDILLRYKRGKSIINDEEGIIIPVPFFFAESLLKALPLFLNNSLPLIFEFELDRPVNGGVSLLCEYTSSSMEASGYDDSFIQYVSNFITTESNIENDKVELNLNSKGKIVKALYFRLFDDDNNDLNIVKSVELKNNEGIFPASLCRTYFKSKYSDKDLPYYVLPFSLNPRSIMPDYGEVFNDDKLVLTLKESIGKKVEVTLETVNKIAWVTR